MSNEDLTRCVLGGLFGLIFAWRIFFQDGREARGEGTGPRYLPFLPNSILPGFLCGLAVLGALKFGWRGASELMLDICFGVFLQICAYYLLLLPALPVLRRHISARACAALWMLPNYLYVVYSTSIEWQRPLWVLRLPGQLVWGVLAVWFLGFLAVLGGKIFLHLRFRREVLKDAVPVTEPEILEVWQAELDRARLASPPSGPAWSPAVRTPLTVGLFRWFSQVLLPEGASYSREDLELILRHEIIHIGRSDAWAKFFLTFCTAMCWFNPLMWRAMRKSAEDLELSCDETVLLWVGEEVRKRYAALLLHTAGDERGFTTCLSASAASLRYRLRSVVRPSRKHTGAVTVGLSFLLLFSTCGGVALAYGGTTGAEAVFRSQEPESYTLRRIYRTDGEGVTDTIVCEDPEALLAYLSELRMERMTGRFGFPSEDGMETLELLLSGEEDTLVITLKDRYAQVCFLGQARNNLNCYLPDGLDWSRLPT